MFRFMVGMCITEDLTSHVVGFRVLGLGVLSLGLEVFRACIRPLSS